jgi:hypothetical protein
VATKIYEMGYTVAEFSKTLQGQFLNDKASYICKTISPSHWEILVSGSLCVTIKISQAPQRNIATLSLPVLNVQFEFSGNVEQQTRFLKRFFKYFHKGGG